MSNVTLQYICTLSVLNVKSHSKWPFLDWSQSHQKGQVHDHRDPNIILNSLAKISKLLLLCEGTKTTEMKNNPEQQNSWRANADIFNFWLKICLSSQQISLLFGVSINDCNSYVTMQANKILYYINTSEIPGELLRVNMISSHVKITWSPLL